MTAENIESNTIESSAPHSPLLAAEFWVLVALQAALPWCFHYFPSCDGPSHVHNAEQLWRWLAGDSFLREYFYLNPKPEGNWFGDLLLMLLVRVAGTAGEKLFLTAYFILLPLSILYALRALRAKNCALPIAFAALPLSYNWMLNDGFYFNIVSLPVMFGMIGWWLSQREKGHAWQNVAGLAGWLLLLYFTHVVTLVVGVAVLICLIICDKKHDGRMAPNSSYPNMNRYLQLVVALIPVIMLFLGVPGGRLGFGAWGDPEVSLPKKIVALFTLYFGLVSFSKQELLIGAAVALGLWGLLLWGLTKHRAESDSALRKGLLLGLVAVTLIFLCAPESLAHGWYLVHRLNIYPFLILVLILGTFQFSPRVTRGIIVLSTLLVLAQLAFYASRYHQLQSYLDEYVSVGNQVAPRSTILALGVSNRGHSPDGRPLSERTKPFEFGASRIGIARQCIVLNDYQAHIGYFPLSYRPERDPFTQIGNVLMEPPRFDKGGPLSYGARTGGRVDYIIFWQDRTDKLSAAQQADLMGPVLEGYDLIKTSEPRGYARLYRRKGFAPAP